MQIFFKYSFCYLNKKLKIYPYLVSIKYHTFMQVLYFVLVLSIIITSSPKKSRERKIERKHMARNCSKRKVIKYQETTCCEEDDMSVMDGARVPMERMCTLNKWKMAGEVLVPGVLNYERNPKRSQGVLICG